MQIFFSAIIVLFSAMPLLKAQLPDTLAIVQLENGNPVSFQVMIYPKEGSVYVKIINKLGVKDDKISYQENKTGLNRLIAPQKDGSFDVHFLKNSNKGYWLFTTLPGLDSFSAAMRFIPDLSLFSTALTNSQRPPYFFKRPDLDTLSKKDMLSLLAFTHHTFKSLRNLCDFMALHTSITYETKSSLEFYTLLKEDYRENAYLNWLNSKGYSGKSYMSLMFELMRWVGNKEVEQKAAEYDQLEMDFYK